MKPYVVYPPEAKVFQDRVSGLSIRQLTSFKGHSQHPYFTDDGWFDNDRKMLFIADRNNARNLYCIDIDSGEISRLTNMPSHGPDLSSPMAVNHAYNETYYQYNGCVYALNLDTLDTRPLYIVPKGYSFGGARPSANGKYIVAGLSEDLSASIKSNLAAGYVGFSEIFAAKPDCRIIRINVLDNTVDEIWRENYWVGHVNPSPAEARLLTFCHEGPWQKVDHRIWVLDVDTGKASKFRERRVEGEMVGHEYWLLDGVHIGYQVHRPKEGGSKSYFGFARYDGTGEIEAPAVRVPGPDHIHSIGFDFVVSDTGKSIKGYKYNGADFDGPRVIAMHDGSFDWGSHHPHPRITRDGKHVVYNSTAAGYCNVYMAPIPDDFYALPQLEGYQK